MKKIELTSGEYAAKWSLTDFYEGAEALLRAAIESGEDERPRDGGVAGRGRADERTQTELLRRVAVGAFRLPDDLAPGKWRDLSEDEVAALFR